MGWHNKIFLQFNSCTVTFLDKGLLQVRCGAPSVWDRFAGEILRGCDGVKTSRLREHRIRTAEEINASFRLQPLDPSSCKYQIFIHSLSPPPSQQYILGTAHYHQLCWTESLGPQALYSKICCCFFYVVAIFHHHHQHRRRLHHHRLIIIKVGLLT